MNTKPGALFVLIVTAALAVGLLLTGCGGGGESISGEGTSSSNNGTVAIFLADGPADDYDSIFISICKVSLIPAEENPNSSEVVIFDPEACFEEDLLRLRDEEILITVNEEIPPGLYAKIRLEVNNVSGEGGPCDSFKLPSGRIDLNPRGGIYVEPGRTLAMHFDMDANKSIHPHETGVPGKCIFRPMVFVEIESIAAPPTGCPKILAGKIVRLILDDSGQTEGFILDLEDERGLIKILLLGESDNPTVIFGEDGNRVRKSALQVDQQVRVRGRLMPRGNLEASVVVIGDVLNISGTVVAPVNDELKFPLWLDPGQAFVGQQVDVEVSAATLILIGCDEQIGQEAIQRGRTSRVIGKYDVDNDVLRAVAVLLEPLRITGDLTGIRRAPNGESGDAILTVADDESNILDILLKQGTPVNLQGDFEVPLGLLNQLVLNCTTAPKRIRIELDPEALEPTATEAILQQERTSGRVAEILWDRVLRLEGGKLVRVQEDADIYLNTKKGDKEVFFEDIEVGDSLTLFGLSDCVDSGVEFYAYIVLIDEQETECDDYDCDDDVPEGCNWMSELPGWISDNNVRICLKNDTYENDLKVNGNNFLLIGMSGSNHKEDGWTIIKGYVTINANNATFKNIIFKGKVNKNGNNIVFKNCRF